MAGESRSDTIEVYVYLPEEGTDTWRPTEAIRMSSSTARLLPTGHYDSGDEIWEFKPGTVVNFEPKILSGGL